VNDLGREILAGPAFAGQQYRRPGARGDLAQQRPEGDHRVAVSDDTVETVRLRLIGAQRPHLTPERGRLQRLFDQQRHLVEVEGLVEVMKGAVLHCFDRHPDAGVGGQHDDERIGGVLLHVLEDR
jgi:hypothetical protein